MKRTALLSLLLLSTLLSIGQSIEFNIEYKDITITKTFSSTYQLKFVKGGVYKVSVMQQGVDVILTLTDSNNKKILDQDSPNGANGPEKFDYVPETSGTYSLSIKRLEEDGNPDTGKVTVLVKSLNKQEIVLYEKNKKELAVENSKTVQTLDLDHFWEAFDNLKKCATHADSVASFDNLYLDRATDGLKDFIGARGFTSEKFVTTVAKFPKFYASVRSNTYECKKAAPLIDEIFEKFKGIYTNFKPFKVCFAIGIVNTGGTVSSNFVLIGSEVSTSTVNTDLSEFNNSAFSKVLAGDKDIVQKIKNIVAHECVHTQQKSRQDSLSVKCPLLYAVMKEGFCDFIGELVAGDQINKVAQAYGDKHEKQLWTELKNELCNTSINNWLYNYNTVKDKPADLGYYMGYKIAQEYYKNAADKKQAVTDIIEMTDPIKFLQLSKYDLKRL